MFPFDDVIMQYNFCWTGLDIIIMSPFITTKWTGLSVESGITWGQCFHWIIPRLSPNWHRNDAVYCKIAANWYLKQLSKAAQTAIGTLLTALDNSLSKRLSLSHDDVIRWKHFPRYWPFARGIHRWPVNSVTKASDAELWCFLWSASE